jgi:hypothetical protein
MVKLESSFGALVLAQAAHSIEEYVGKLWESFPPARFVVGLVSEDPQRGFILVNACIIAFGIWCYVWPVRRKWPAAKPIIWLWVAVEGINGIGHPFWSIRQGGYTPGVLTAFVLLILAVQTAILVTRQHEAPAA